MIDATPRFEVTALGETMLRLSVPVGRRLEEAAALELHPGGAESNVCAALASLGRRCGWVSRLPDNPLSHLVLRRFRAARIDTSAVVLTQEGRLGTYFVEFSVPPRATRVTYDRKGSAFSRVDPSELDWDYLLDTRMVHLTGITPALSDTCYELVRETVSRAKAAGVAVCFDVNYRRTLWSPECAARSLPELFEGVDLLICKAADAQGLFGLSGDASHVLNALQELSSARQVVLTQGTAGAWALGGGRVFHHPALAAEVVDRIGAGDAFAAGVIDGWLDGSLSAGLQRGTALAALAVAQHGDMLVTSREELEELVQGVAEGIVR